MESGVYIFDIFMRFELFFCCLNDCFDNIIFELFDGVFLFVLLVVINFLFFWMIVCVYGMYERFMDSIW